MTMERRRPIALTRTLPLPIEPVVAALRDDGLGVVSDAPIDRGVGRTTLRPGPAARVSCPVEVHVGPLVEEDEVVGLPLWWEASRWPAWFPALDAGLEAAPLPDGMELRLVGRYRVPCGPVGAYADGLIGHRIANACLEQFLSETTERLSVRIAPLLDRGSVR